MCAQILDWGVVWAFARILRLGSFSREAEGHRVYSGLPVCVAIVPLKLLAGVCIGCPFRQTINRTIGGFSQLDLLALSREKGNITLE